ncbi:MAG: pyruvate dehydrogenase (acetyl-transferring) E1 component subunit alpha [Opitutales bacterium]|nr:pyruvate dehydrogenase (acetyl-transferring) E1 component subunit alpha [Opitutales bacterium]
MTTAKSTNKKKTVARKKTGKASSGPDINASLSPEEKRELYRTMVRIRRFEERSLKSYTQEGKIGGFLHLYIGQESVAVGSVSLMEENDHVITAYRDHGHALAVGMTMKECMAELYGRATGCSKGKGGSMHFFAPDKRYWGGHGIVGGQTPLGAGLAYALKYKGLKGCCLCYLGDGAVNQGAYHESLNLAALWNLPVVYIIENNHYSMGTSQKRSSAGAPLAKRAEGYDMDWEVVDGSHIYNVRKACDVAMKRAREESRPSILEIQTYRYRGHSVADANDKKYRTKEEIQKYMNERDPINVFKQTLLEEKVLTEEDADQISKEARDEANESADFANESPYLDKEEILTDVYWESDNDRDEIQKGRIFFNDDF